MKPYQVKKINLKGNRKLINAVKAAGLTTEYPFVGMSGRYPIKTKLHVVIKSVGDMRKFNKIKKGLDAEPPKPKKTPEQIRQEWAERLVKLLPEQVTLERALEIADEKIDYKHERIWAMEMRQIEHYSAARDKLMKEMGRKNPLRRIKDVAHAERILASSTRHNETQYEEYLDRAYQLAKEGVIEHEDIKYQAKKWMYEEIEEAQVFDC